MPWIGTSTDITSLEQLQTLDPETRLSIQKNKEGKDLLVATKGTLSDGLYSIWATFCPKQDAAYRNQLANNIFKYFFPDSTGIQKANFNKILLSSENSSNSATESLMTAKITIGKITPALIASSQKGSFELTSKLERKLVQLRVQAGAKIFDTQLTRLKKENSNQ